MPLTIKDILFGLVTPAITACATFTVIQCLFLGPYRTRYATSLAQLAGFLIGYRLLSLGPWMATSHWHWLPVALIAAAVVGPVSCADGVGWMERLLLYLLVALVSAWFLVPTWDDLAPSRIVHFAVWAPCVAVTAALLELLAKRSKDRILLTVLWATIVTTAVLLALSGSLRFAQIALAGAGSLFGIVITSWWRREAANMTGAGLQFSMLIVGSLLIGRVNSFSEVPLASYLLVPLAPISLWLFASGPLSNIDGWKRSLAALVVPVGLFGSAIALAVMAQKGAAG